MLSHMIANIKRIRSEKQKLNMPACLFLVISMLSLSACAHNILIVGRNNGLTGKATISTTGNKSGIIEIALGPKTYSGQWVYVPKGGAFAFGNTTFLSGNQTVNASGTATALPMGGDGTVLASSTDGSTLRCEFNFSEFGRTGVGTCQDNKNAIYDMQIN